MLAHTEKGTKERKETFWKDCLGELEANKIALVIFPGNNFPAVQISGITNVALKPPANHGKDS